MSRKEDYEEGNNEVQVIATSRDTDDRQHHPLHVSVTWLEHGAKITFSATFIDRAYTQDYISIHRIIYTDSLKRPKHQEGKYV